MSSECSSNKTRSSADGVNFRSCSIISIGSWSLLSIDKIALRMKEFCLNSIQAFRNSNLTWKYLRRSSSTCSTELCSFELDARQSPTELLSSSCCQPGVSLQCLIHRSVKKVSFNIALSYEKFSNLQLRRFSGKLRRVYRWTRDPCCCTTWFHRVHSKLYLEPSCRGASTS